MVFSLNVQIEGIEETLEFIQSIPSTTQKRVLRTFRIWGRDMVDLGKELSPKDKLRGVDPRRRPEAESFAMLWDYEIEPIGQDAVELRVGNLAPHMPFVIYGTQPHPIPTSVTEQLTKGYPMRFVWRGVWHTAWKISGGVAAHGTEPHPVHEEIVQQFNFPGRMAELARGI